MSERTEVVSCHSGRIYADRPLSFVHSGIEHRVAEVLSEWLEPGERHFLVRTHDGERYELCYSGNRDAWSVVPKSP